MELENKIKEYVHNKSFEQTSLNEIAHDITEIAANELLPKDVIKIIKQLEQDNTTLKDINKGLGEMVDELKQQLADTLGRFEGEMDLNTKVMKENAELKDKLDKLMNDTSQCDICLDLCFENEKLTKQLADKKYLNRNEVEKIIPKYGNYSTTEEHTSWVTAICNLAPEQRYLNFDEVHKLFQKHIQWNDDDTVKDIQIIDLEEDICNLAIPITKKNIKEAIWRKWNWEHGLEWNSEQIADEILNNKTEIGEGK